MFKAGYIAIVGRPNAGKSTLLNNFLGQKVAVVSKKPETTRDNILGILTTKQYQAIFVDTPGYHLPKHLLGKVMVKRAQSSIVETDIVLMLVDATKGFEKEEERLIDFLRSCKKSASLLIINKIDLVKKEILLPLIEKGSALYPFKEIIPISAIKKNYIDVVLKKIVEYLPENPQFFPDDELTDRDEHFFIRELIREKTIELTFEEIPHAVAVLIEEIREGKGEAKKVRYIRACIFVEKPSQKKIVIGKNGAMIKKIGQGVRGAIKELFGEEVFLDLWVKVQPNWRKDEVFLKKLGYL